MRPAWRRRYVRYKRLFLSFFNQYKERQDIKIFLEILLTLVTISVFSLFALRPTIITIAELIKEIEVKKETVATMDEKIQNLSRAQTLYEQQITRINLLKTSIPYDPSPDAFVRQIEGLTAKYAINLASMSLGNLTLLGNNQTSRDDVLGTSSQISFSLHASANYSPLYSYLSDIENTRRPIIIKSLNVSSIDTEEGKIVTLTFEGNTPYLEDTTKIK